MAYKSPQSSIQLALQPLSNVAAYKTSQSHEQDGPYIGFKVDGTPLQASLEGSNSCSCHCEARRLVDILLLFSELLDSWADTSSTD